MAHDLNNATFTVCRICNEKPMVFVNLSYFDMITCRCRCGEKDYPTVLAAEENWNKDNGKGLSVIDSINKYYNDIVYPGLGATGVGGDPLFRFIEREYLLLCEKGIERSLYDLVSKVKQRIALYRENKENPHYRNARSIQEYLLELDKIEKELQDFCSVITCPLEDVPLYLNSEPAFKVAKRRLSDAK